MSDFWIGLRVDGVELTRVRAECHEVSRSNGLAKFQTLGPVVLADIPADVDGGALTVSMGPDSTPFAAVDLPWHLPYDAGSSLHFPTVDFIVVRDVPKHVAPERKPPRKKQRVRLTR